MLHTDDSLDKVGEFYMTKLKAKKTNFSSKDDLRLEAHESKKDYDIDISKSPSVPPSSSNPARVSV